MKYFFSVDLGTQKDYTAVSILERTPVGKPKNALPGTPEFAVEEPKYSTLYRLRHLERFPLGMDYPSIVDRLRMMISHEKLHRQTALIVDATGVGLPVIQMMQQVGLDPIGITITGGTAVTKGTGMMYNVPKGELVSALNLVFQSRRIRIPTGIALKAEFMKELERFEVTMRKTGNTYEAAVASIHDDLVLSVAMGCWYAEKTEGALFYSHSGKGVVKQMIDPLKELL